MSDLTTLSQSSETIRVAAQRLDDALEAGDEEIVLSCFAETCVVELLNERLYGRAGVKKWLAWMRAAGVERIRLEPRAIAVEGDVFFEEFVARSRLVDGRQVVSRQAEMLTYENNKVVSLRLYFDPLDFAETQGWLATLIARVIRKRIRTDLA